MVAISRSFTDALGVTDPVTGTVHKTIPADHLGITETVTPSRGIVLVVTDTMSGVDTAIGTPGTAPATFTRYPVEAVTISDASATQSTQDIYTDPVGISEQVNRTSTIKLVFNDSNNIVDSINRTSHTTLVFTEVVGPIETVQNTLNSSPTAIFEDPIGIIESVFPVLTSIVIPPNDIEISVLDSVGIGESVQILINVDFSAFNSSTFVEFQGQFYQSSWALLRNGAWIYPSVWVLENNVWVQIQ